MSIHYPYRAVILGEEHIVKGWKGRQLITDKGKFFVQYIHGNWRIQDYRIFEISTIQSDGKNGWLINGKELSLLKELPMNSRLDSIPKDEPLRVHKHRICAFALVQAALPKDITKTLDLVLESWKSASERAEEDEKAFRLRISQPFDISDAILKAFDNNDNRQLLASWSKPVWFTEFRPANEPAPLTHDQKKLAATTAALKQTKAQLTKAEAAAGDTLAEALSKWMRFEPPGMSANTKARIEKAVKFYMTNRDMRSLAKIAKEFKVSRTCVSKWFKLFTKETSFPVVTHQRHESVRDHIKDESKEIEEDES